MLAVNDEILNLNDKTNVYVKRVLSAVEKLKEITNNNIRMEYTDIHITNNPDDKRKKEYATLVRIPMSERMFINGIDEKWTYFSDRKRVGENYKYKPRQFEFVGNVAFDSQTLDIGLLFFLAFISPHCETVPHLTGEFAQNPRPATKHFRMPMPTFEAVKKAESRRKEGEISHTIYKTLKIDVIKKIALSMGVINVEQLTDPQLRNTLYDIATVNDDNMEKFFSKINNSEDVTKETEDESIIQTAIDNKIIGLSKSFGRPVWKFKAEKGWGDEICQVVPGESEREKLFNFLNDNKDIFDVIKTKVNAK
jgi:hypothetical protein